MLRVLTIAAVAIAAAVAAYGSYVASRPNLEIGLNQPVRQDDFTYTVSAVRRSARIGAAHANGVFFVVSIRVDNHAKTVAYRWEPGIVSIEDDAGNQYRVSRAGQFALDLAGQSDSMIEAGRSAVYRVAFDLPAGVGHPVLKFSNGVMMGDALDGIQYMRIRVRLWSGRL